MPRVPGYPSEASPGHKTMTRTIQCPQCGVVLNVPDSAAGRKLKCPKCATKFATPSGSPADSAIAETGPSSTMFPTRHGPGSSGSIELPTTKSSGSVELPTSGPKKGGGGFDFDLPTASDAPLRDMFDLPLLSDPAPKSSPGQPKAPTPADALALFQDEPKANRKPKGAEARSKARRCPSCGGVVAIGMSLCSTCGLDLDTGQRIAPLEVFEEEMPEAPRAEMPPLGVLFVGSLCAMANLLLSAASLIAWQKGQDGVQFLLVVWLFGLYASVQFLRRKSIRPLFLALALGVGIGVVALIVLPIYQANVEPDAAVTNPEFIAKPIDPDAPPVVNIAERLNASGGVTKITWGIALLLGYAALSVYLNSPSMKRQLKR